MNIRIALVACLLALAACGSEKKKGAAWDGKVASCNMPSAGYCEEYRDANLALGTESLAKLCMPEISASAKFTETACPTDGVVASCKKPTKKELYYEPSGMTAADVEAMCTRGGEGKFTAGK